MQDSELTIPLFMPLAVPTQRVSSTVNTENTL